MSEKRAAAFIAKATVFHEGKYDYSLVGYTGIRGVVTIVCPEHGEFQQRPDIHLRSGGCRICGSEHRVKTMKKRQSNPEAFFEKAKAIHGDLYDYTDSIYIKGDKPITIKCATHGEFTVGRAEKHVDRAQGCPHCISGNSHAERVIRQVLDELGVVYFREFKFDKCVSPITNRKLQFDFYIPSKNLIVEFHGDQHFKKSSMMHKGDLFERMQEHDRVKAQFVLDQGIALVTFTTANITQLRELVTKLVS